MTLTNPIDGMEEEISIPGPHLGLTVTPDMMSHQIEIAGIASNSIYTDVLRTLTYQHSDYSPGNPTTSEPRYVVHFGFIIITFDIAVVQRSRVK